MQSVMIAEKSIFAALGNVAGAFLRDSCRSSCASYDQACPEAIGKRVILDSSLFCKV